MRCPICKIPSLEPVESAGAEVDRCGACGAVWFDPGEIRELTEGRLDTGLGGDGTVPAADAGEIPGEAEEGERPPSSPLAGWHRKASSMRCPRCGMPFSALDFQATGVPVLMCKGCRGILAPGASVGQLAERFRFTRTHADLYAAMGNSLAREMKKTLSVKYIGEDRLGTGEGRPIALPVVVPLATDAPENRSFPVASWIFMALPLVLLLFSSVTGGECRLPGESGGLPSGDGWSRGNLPALAAYAFLPGGLLPLATGLPFLYLMGRPVEDRMGWFRFGLLYVAGALVAGAVHLAIGKAGAPPALGPAGAVAAVLGAYLVFFPNVPVRMYGLGRVESVPAYIFACCWLVAMFLYSSGGGVLRLLDSAVNHAPLSLAGHLGGFLAGGAAAGFFRAREEGLV